MKLTLGVRNAPRVALQLRAFSKSAREGIRDVVGEYGAKQHARTYDLCPKDTFFMADHIRTVFSKGGYHYQTGWYEREFRAAGRAFYPPFQEYGTRFMSAQPCLFPARDEILPRFNRALAAAIRKATNASASQRRRSR